MKIIYVAREKLTAGRAPTLQILHTLRGISLSGGTVQFVTPWSSRQVQRRAIELTGRALPDEVEIVSIGPGPPLPILARRWPAPVWRGIRLRCEKHLKAVRVRDPDAVVYSRNRRIVASMPPAPVPPMIFEIHDMRARSVAEATNGNENDPQVQLLSAEERRAMDNASGLVTLTQCMADDLARTYEIHCPVWHVPDGVDPELFPPRDRSRRTVPGQFVYLGSLAEWKGIELALKALRYVPGAMLDVYGGRDGSRDMARLVEAANRLAVGSRVRFRGLLPHPRLSTSLSSAIAGILPLDGRYSIAARFTSPLKLFEYLSTGVPVLASDLPSVREVVAHDREALLFEDGNPLALAAAMSRIMNEPGLADRLAAEACKTAQSFTWRRRGERIVEACRTVLATRTGLHRPPSA